MKHAPLLDYLAERDRLMTWFEGFLADCAKRRAMRENKLSERAMRGHATQRARFRAIDAFQAGEMR